MDGGDIGRNAEQVVGHGATGPAFVTPLELSEIDKNGAGDVALALALPCWTLLGMLDRAIELTIAHISLRKQFGQPLSTFQGVQFQLTDAEVERSGLEILAKYALWSIGSDKPEALVDALALRMSAIEAAEVVFRVCHQLHGAVGFCDETTLSWLSRYSQPLRRLPLGLSATRDELTRRAGPIRSHRVVRSDGPTSTSSVPTSAPWCQEHIPPDWRATQTGVGDDEFVAFQKWWFAELHAAGFAVPHWPREWGGGMSVGRTDRALFRTRRPRCAAAGARLRRNPSRRVDPAGRGHRRAARQAPARHPRR